MDIELSKEEFKLLRNAYKDFRITPDDIIADIKNVMRNESCSKDKAMKIIVKFMNNVNG